MTNVKEITVMIVDDDDLVRAYLRIMLRDLGVLNIQEAGTGEKALREMKLKQINLIFLDINLPDVDGVEFFQGFMSRGQLEQRGFKLQCSIVYLAFKCFCFNVLLFRLEVGLVLRKYGL